MIKQNLDFEIAPDELDFLDYYVKDNEDIVGLTSKWGKDLVALARNAREITFQGSYHIDKGMLALFNVVVICLTLKEAEKMVEILSSRAKDLPDKVKYIVGFIEGGHKIEQSIFIPIQTIENPFHKEREDFFEK